MDTVFAAIYFPGSLWFLPDTFNKKKHMAGRAASQHILHNHQAHCTGVTHVLHNCTG